MNLIFWGYLFVLLQFNIEMIDILPDPIGYCLIASGCFGLREHYPIAQKAGIFAVGMIFVSIPTTFVNLDGVISFGWGIYSAGLLFLKLILAYAVFLILKRIVEDYEHTALINRTNTVFTFYMTFNLLSLAFLSFSMNMPSHSWLAVVAILTFIMEIIFIVLIRAIRNAEPVHAEPIIDAPIN
ncbi:hypothetical protein [Sporosarcina sp. 6E9]|uniref:hypothetical protein n=1 Tax=Sporosarcina sp. 6E9 TaxID=2819235 RepID=UPI001B31184A|nr:hypothetical protein [Sporosarcina sp. 6E9]